MLDFINNQTKSYENKAKAIELIMHQSNALYLSIQLQNKAFVLEQKQINILQVFRLTAQCMDLINNFAKKVKKKPSFFTNYYEQKIISSDMYRHLQIELAISQTT